MEITKAYKFDDQTQRELDAIEKEYNKIPYMKTKIEFGISDKGNTFGTALDKNAHHELVAKYLTTAFNGLGYTYKVDDEPTVSHSKSGTIYVKGAGREIRISDHMGRGGIWTPSNDITTLSEAKKIVENTKTYQEIEAINKIGREEREKAFQETVDFEKQLKEKGLGYKENTSTFQTLEEFISNKPAISDILVEELGKKYGKMKYAYRYIAPLDSISKRAPNSYIEWYNKMNLDTIVEKDVLGNNILTADEWNSLSKDEQEILKETITKQITDPYTGQSISVDYNLAEPLQQIINLGYATGQSDSGTTTDHPGYRYVADDSLGNFIKGELIQGGSYLTFWKPEATVINELGRAINNEQQIDTIRNVAKDKGFICEDSMIFYQPSIRLTLPETNDGTAKSEILRQSNELTNKQYPGLHETDFFKWLDFRNDVFRPQVLEQHGGKKEYTDIEIISMWNNLAQGLEIEKIKEVSELSQPKQSNTIMEKPKKVILLDSSKQPSGNIDFNKYKTEISFPDFLIDNYGFQPDKGSSLRYPKLKNDTTGEVLVIKRNANQQYTYFSVHDDSVKGRSILDFVQKELAKDNPNGKQPSLTVVAETLEGYMSSGKVVPPDNSKYYIDAALWNTADNFSDIKKLTEITENDFLKSRGFLKSTLENPLFKGVFFERSYNKDGFVHTNTAIKLFNNEGLAGLSQRNTSFKGCLGNRFDSLATSIPVKGKEYDAYFLGESFLDCVAHYELNEKRLRDKTVAYLSSEGAITSGQIALFNKLIIDRKPTEISTIFDKDLAGIAYNLKVMSELHIDGKTSNLVVTFHEDKINKMVFLSISNPNGSDINFQQTLGKAFSKDNFSDLADNPAVEVQLMVKDDNISTYQVAIPRQYNMIERAIEKIQELRFGPEKVISMERPITLDFNDDLKASKGMHPDWQIKEINNVRRAVYKGNLLPLEGKENSNTNEMTI